MLYSYSTLTQLDSTNTTTTQLSKEGLLLLSSLKQNHNEGEFSSSQMIYPGQNRCCFLLYFKGCIARFFQSSLKDRKAGERL